VKAAFIDKRGLTNRHVLGCGQEFLSSVSPISFFFVRVKLLIAVIFLLSLYRVLNRDPFNLLCPLFTPVLLSLSLGLEVSRSRQLRPATVPHYNPVLVTTRHLDRTLERGRVTFRQGQTDSLNRAQVVPNIQRDREIVLEPEYSQTQRHIQS